MISNDIGWTFLTNQARVFVFVAKHPYSTIKHISWNTDLTERTVQNILAQLEASGCISRKKVGRRNIYTVNPLAPMRHELERNHTVGEILMIFERDLPTKGSHV